MPGKYDWFRGEVDHELLKKFVGMTVPEKDKATEEDRQMAEHIAQRLSQATYLRLEAWHRHAVGVIVQALPSFRAAARLAGMRDALAEAAKMLMVEVERHRADGEYNSRPGHFCKEYGCSTLEDFAAALRKRAEEAR